MEGFGPETYGEGFADVYDDWYPHAEETPAAVAALAGLAGPGAVLELGAGTGRLAIPLAAGGRRVVAVDASPAMLERLRAKPGGDAVEAVVADLARLDEAAVDGPFALAVLAVNTLFNVADAAGQQALVRAVASLLAGDGALVVEALVPDPDPAGPQGTVEPVRIEVDRVVLRVARGARRTQSITGQHVVITEDGGVRLRPWLLRYVTPDELDAMAAAAGLALAERWRDWTGAPFAPGDRRHVSVYRPAGPARGSEGQQPG